jgi:hypothetical protein
MLFPKSRIVKTTGWKDPTTATELQDGDTNWSGETNVLSSNDSYATVSTSPTNDNTSLLMAQGFDFAEVSGQILGVEVRYERKTSSASTSATLWLLNASGNTGGTTGKGDVLPTSDEYASFGGSSDRWNHSLTASIVRNANFGVGIRGTGTNGPTVTISVDHIQVRVTYAA